MNKKLSKLSQAIDKHIVLTSEVIHKMSDLIEQIERDEKRLENLAKTYKKHIEVNESVDHLCALCIKEEMYLLAEGLQKAHKTYNITYTQRIHALIESLLMEENLKETKND